MLEEKEEKLCVKVLRTLREMMAIDPDYGEKVSQNYSKIVTNLLLMLFWIISFHKRTSYTNKYKYIIKNTLTFYEFKKIKLIKKA